MEPSNKMLDSYRRYVGQQILTSGKKTLQSLFSLHHSRTKSDEDYEQRVLIGEGTFGEVSKAVYRKNGKEYALKRIRFNSCKEGFPITLIRELMILMKFKHVNVVEFKDFRKKKTSRFQSFMEVFLVFELCKYDLCGLLKEDCYLTFSQRKSILQQMFTGLCFIHDQRYIHRDLKCANILVTENGVVKIADFGLSRYMAPSPQTCTPLSVRGGHNEALNAMTPNVITLWYRAPELLLQYPNYNSSVDMWSAGCIVYEVWTRTHLFKGNQEVSQLRSILEFCGPLTSEIWPELEQSKCQWGLELVKSLQKSESSHLRQSKMSAYLTSAIKKPASAVELLENLLHLNPNKRFNCHQALASPFFTEEPVPGGLEDLSKVVRQSAYEFSKSVKRPSKIDSSSGPKTKQLNENYLVKY